MGNWPPLSESKIYFRLHSLQGDCIPACLGTSTLKLPYYYACGVYITMLFLSWAGRPLYQYNNREHENDVIERATSALKALHKLRVLHKDAEPRNMLWDEHRGKLMLVDLEPAEIQTRSPLGITAIQHSLALEVAIVDRQLVWRETSCRLGSSK